MNCSQTASGRASIAEIGPQENMRYGMQARPWSRSIRTGQAVLIDASADRHFNRGTAW